MLLITAFEPFGGERLNTSSEVLGMLPEKLCGREVRKTVLPVVFGKAAEKALSLPASCIFMLGEAGGRAEVTPELKARNLRQARIPDNEGNQPRDEKILPDGPEEYRTVFPVREAVERMRSDGYRISVSEDAGTYVCNDTFYLTGIKAGVPVAFIHVPHRTEEIGELAETVRRFMELVLINNP